MARRKLGGSALDVPPTTTTTEAFWDVNSTHVVSDDESQLSQSREVSGSSGAGRNVPRKSPTGADKLDNAGRDRSAGEDDDRGGETNSRSKKYRESVMSSSQEPPESMW